VRYPQSEFHHEDKLDTGEALNRFDQMAKEAAAFLRRGLRTTAVASLIDSQPFRHAGNGHRLMAPIAPFASWGSLANAAAHLSARRLDEFTGKMAREVTLTYQTVADRVGEDVTPMLPPDTTDGPSVPQSCIGFYTAGDGKGCSKLQKHFTHSWYKVTSTQLMESLAPAATKQSRLQLALEVPNECFRRHSRMPAAFCPPKAHVLAVRMHLNYAPVDHMPAMCFCGHALQHDPWHWLSCDHMKAVAMTARHKGIVHTLANWITRIGGACDIEPSQVFDRPDRPNQRRADLRVPLGGLHLLVTTTSM
jgi:hypothetical protein